MHRQTSTIIFLNLNFQRAWFLEKPYNNDAEMGCKNNVIADKNSNFAAQAISPKARKTKSKWIQAFA